MKIKAKKSLSLLLALFIILSAMWAGLTAFADDNIAINESNFSDPVFRQVLMSEFDDNGDGYLSIEERNVPFISFSGYLDDYQKISDLDGIEFFADSLTSLYCGGIGLEKLDVSALSKLTSLTCQGNNLTSLDVSSNTALVSLDCSNNSLDTLVLGTNPNLKTVLCYLNYLESIDLSGLSGLEAFRCDQNELTSLDVSKNTQLSSFTCAYNHLTSLDLSANSLLSDISQYQIGNQAITVTAQAQSSSIMVPVSVSDVSRITSVSSSTGGNLVYLNSYFMANDVSEIDNGINYTYSVGLAGCEDLNVFVSVIRNFYQVNFYNSQEMTDLIGKSFVSPNASAQAPAVTPSGCTVFDSWNADITNITADTSVYALWKEAHTYALADFKDDVATITCSQCDSSYTVNFTDCINKSEGSVGYNQYLDVVADGVINAKDYAELTKMF